MKTYIAGVTSACIGPKVTAHARTIWTGERQLVCVQSDRTNITFDMEEALAVARLVWALQRLGQLPQD